MGLVKEEPGFNLQQVQEILFLSTASHPMVMPTQPPIEWVSGALFPGTKWVGCEAEYSPAPSGEFKNVWIYIPIIPYVFIAW